MTAILNRIIAISGTTAHQHPKVEAKIRADYIDGSEALTCLIAAKGDTAIGLQTVGLWPTLPAGWGDIGTFVASGIQAKGISAALFEATCTVARTAKLTALNATMRADNGPELDYYARIGFVDYAHELDWCLEDGIRTGRVSRRFDL